MRRSATGPVGLAEVNMATLMPAMSGCMVGSDVMSGSVKWFVVGVASSTAVDAGVGCGVGADSAIETGVGSTGKPVTGTGVACAAAGVGVGSMGLGEPE